MFTFNISQQGKHSFLEFWLVVIGQVQGMVALCVIFRINLRLNMLYKAFREKLTNGYRGIVNM